MISRCQWNDSAFESRARLVLSDAVKNLEACTQRRVQIRSPNRHVCQESIQKALQRHQRTPIGGRGPKLELEVWADCSESMRCESPLPVLALAEPVRLRT